MVWSPRVLDVSDTIKAWIATLASARVTDPEFKPVSSWYARRYPREEPGVLAKTVGLVGRVRLVRTTAEMVEAEVPSETDPSKTYRVRIYATPRFFDFECDCPHGEHRFNPCKHVIAVVLRILADSSPMLEDLGLDSILGRRVATLVHYALCVHAYLKARQFSLKA